MSFFKSGKQDIKEPEMFEIKYKNYTNLCQSIQLPVINSCFALFFISSFKSLPVFH